VLLNKLDLVTADEAAAAERRVRALNPLARLHGTRRCAVDLSSVLERHAFDLDRVLAIEPDFLTSDHAHEHDPSVGSVSLAFDRPLDHERVVGWLADFLQERGADVLRCKGIVDVAGNERRFVVQGVHMLLDGDFGLAWREGERRHSRLVFIGRGLDAAALGSALEACAA